MTKWQRVAFDPRTNEQTTETTFRTLCSSSFGVLQVLPKCCCHTWPRSQTLIADAIPISSTRTDADVAKVNKAKLCLLFVALVAWRAASDPKHIAKHIQWNSLRLMEEQIWDPFFPHKLCIGCLFFLRSFQKQIHATSRGPNSRWSQLPKKKHIIKKWLCMTSTGCLFGEQLCIYILTTTPLWTCPSHFFLMARRSPPWFYSCHRCVVGHACQLKAIKPCCS